MVGKNGKVEDLQGKRAVASRNEPETRSERFDVVVIGAGAGGLTAAIGLSSFAKKVALVEAKHVGGDCTNFGCIPSKTLIHLARSGERNPFAQVRAKRDSLRDEETAELGDTEHITLIKGWAEIREPGLVAVLDADGEVLRQLRCDDVVVATGSRPRTLNIEGLSPDRILTNETVWDLEEPPQRLAIVGGGAVGLELAGAFAELGSSVVVVDVADRLLVDADAAVSEILAATMAAKGIDVHLGSAVEGADETSAGVSLKVGGEQLEPVECVLVAVGRAPNVGGFGLDNVGVEVDDLGIKIDSWARTSVDRIWAVGDCTGRTHTTHGANMVGRRVIRAVAVPYAPKVGAPPSVPRAVYTEPEVAWVGVDPDVFDRVPEGLRLRLRVDIADTDRGYTDDVELGAVIVEAERLTGKILKASIVGPSAAELIGIFTLAIDQGISMHKLYRLVHPYPAHAGAIGKIADAYALQTWPKLSQEGRVWLKHLPRRLGTRLGLG